MNSIHTESGIVPQHDDLRQANVRELIVQLALVEDEHRNAADPLRTAALSRREQAIVAALHEHGLAFRSAQIPNPPKQGTVPCPAQDRRRDGRPIPGQSCAVDQANR